MPLYQSPPVFLGECLRISNLLKRSCVLWLFLSAYEEHSLCSLYDCCCLNLQTWAQQRIWPDSPAWSICFGQRPYRNADGVWQFSRSQNAAWQHWQNTGLSSASYFSIQVSEYVCIAFALCSKDIFVFCSTMQNSIYSNASLLSSCKFLYS